MKLKYRKPEIQVYEIQLENCLTSASTISSPDDSDMTVEHEQGPDQDYEFEWKNTN